MTASFEKSFASLRIRSGLKQQELADAIGVSRQTVSNWETGRGIPKLTPTQFKKILKVLHITADELPDSFGPIDIDKTAWLERLRRDAGLSREQIARSLSVGKATVSESEVKSWEEGIKPDLSLAQIGILCEMLGISAKRLSEILE